MCNCLESFMWGIDWNKSKNLYSGLHSKLVSWLSWFPIERAVFWEHRNFLYLCNAIHDGRLVKLQTSSHLAQLLVPLSGLWMTLQRLYCKQLCILQNRTKMTSRVSESHGCWHFGLCTSRYSAISHLPMAFPREPFKDPLSPLSLCIFLKISPSTLPACCRGVSSIINTLSRLLQGDDWKLHSAWNQEPLGKTWGTDFALSLTVQATAFTLIATSKYQSWRKWWWGMQS